MSFAAGIDARVLLCYATLSRESGAGAQAVIERLSTQYRAARPNGHTSAVELLDAADAARTDIARCVVITGASRGLGRALAGAYARPGTLLGLVARDEKALALAANACREAGAEVRAQVADITQPTALETWLAALDRERPIDLLIANAGQFDGRRPGADGEDIERAISLLRTNLEGTVRTIDAVLPLMRAHGRGHIAVIASLAAVFPLADAPVYSASKAGLAAYAEALGTLVAGTGIRISVVYPGHIATRQTEIHEGALPSLMSPEAAAHRIVLGLTRRRRRLWLPTMLALGARLGAFLPPPLRRLAAQSQRFSVRNAARDN